MNTADRILFLLKTRGPQTAQQLADLLKLTSMGTRRQLEAWRGAGMIASDDRSEKVGRPARYWRLSEAGHARFPDRHSELTVHMIADVRRLFGQGGLDQLIAAREMHSEARYRSELGSTEKLADRITKLAEVRTDEGYMASVTVAEDGNFLLAEDHCPICAAATECQGFCRFELAVFQRCLGNSCEVTRVEHLLSGARRCVYQIKAI